MIHDDETSEDLVAFLRGELSRQATGALASHLRSCERCRSDLVDVAEVHSALTAVGRVLQAPVAARPAVADGVPGTASATPGALMEAAIPAAAELPPLRWGQGPSWAGRAVVAIAACAAAVLVVVGAGAGLNALREDRRPAPAAAPPVRTVVLQQVQGSTPGGGQVSMAGRPSAVGSTAMTISTTGLRPEEGRFYYAWLLDPQTKKMVPLGVITAGGQTTLDVPNDIVGKYHTVDISLQQDNGDPAHSGDSVLRASY
ncbi:MAG: anti-sigma factor [Angustibacter sp.]